MLECTGWWEREIIDVAWNCWLAWESWRSVCNMPENNHDEMWLNLLGWHGQWLSCSMIPTLIILPTLSSPAPPFFHALIVSPCWRMKVGFVNVKNVNWFYLVLKYTFLLFVFVYKIYIKCTQRKRIKAYPYCSVFNQFSYVYFNTIRVIGIPKKKRD